MKTFLKNNKTNEKMLLKQSKSKKFTAIDIEALIKECKKSMPNFYPVVLLAVNADINLSEILNLNIEDIDLANQTITIKNRLINRNIAIGCDTISALKTYTKNHGIKKGVLFKNVLNKPLSDAWAINNFKKLLKLSGNTTNRIHFYDLRTYQKIYQN